jgi:hypothetical protein
MRLDSKTEIEPPLENAFPREFLVNSERIQTIISSRHIKDTEADFAAAASEAITDVEVPLCEVIPGQRLGVTGIMLQVPKRLSLGKEAGWMVVE